MQTYPSPRPALSVSSFSFPNAITRIIIAPLVPPRSDSSRSSAQFATGKSGSDTDSGSCLPWFLASIELSTDH